MKAKPKKRFGQHFLTDQNVIHKIMDCFQARNDQFICEIGPGQGALTDPLLEKVDCIHAIEIDQDLAQALRDKYSARLILHRQDVLQFPLDQLTQQERSIRLIGNLPYNISTPLLFHLLAYRHLISDMLFMLQKDVVDRIVAKPGNKVYGRLSVMLQAFCKVQSMFSISANCFFPPPKVESAIIHLQPLDCIDIANFNHFANIVRLAFGQRRKTLRNSLKSLVSEEMFHRAEIDPGLRAENISVKQFIFLANCLPR